MIFCISSEYSVPSQANGGLLFKIYIFKIELYKLYQNK